jgi:hypothetical protein
MRLRLQSVLPLLMMAILVTATSARAADTMTSSASVTITAGFGVGKNNDLEFGFISPSLAAGTVVIPASFPASRTATGGAVLVSGGLTGPAQFSIIKNGGGNPHFDVTLPVGALTISNGTGDTMTVDTWTQNALTSSPYSAAPFTLYVGGTLNVGASQPAGTYTGVFTITVNQH